MSVPWGMLYIGTHFSQHIRNFHRFYCRTSCNMVPNFNLNYLSSMFLDIARFETTMTNYENNKHKHIFKGLAINIATKEILTPKDSTGKYLRIPNVNYKCSICLLELSNKERSQLIKSQKRHPAKNILSCEIYWPNIGLKLH